MMVVGMTDPMTSPAKRDAYFRWVAEGVGDAQIHTLSCKEWNINDIALCDGLILTGGGDVHPKHYGRMDALEIVKEVNEERDHFEFTIINEAMKRNLPLLGVCRGAQVFNVALGGSLIPDIEQRGYPSHASGKDGEREHDIEVVDGTLLAGIAAQGRGTVNTYHHQAIDTVAPGFCVSARAVDGVVEAIEWEVSGQHPFLLMIQWHPERMPGAEQVFSRSIIQRFGNEMRHCKNKRQTITTH